MSADHSTSPANGTTQSPGLAELQAEVDRHIRGTGKGYFDELTNLARLTEETGELARIYARTRGQLKPKAEDDVSPEALRREMGDLLFVLMCLANQADVDLAQALDEVLAKYRTRDRGRHD